MFFRVVVSFEKFGGWGENINIFLLLKSVGLGLYFEIWFNVFLFVVFYYGDFVVILDCLNCCLEVKIDFVGRLYC